MDEKLWKKFFGINKTLKRIGCYFAHENPQTQ